MLKLALLLTLRGAAGGLFSSDRSCQIESCDTWWTQRLPVADQFVKGEDGAASYGCEITWIKHHPPTLIIKDGWSEVERVELSTFRSKTELRRLMESKGFRQTDEYKKAQQAKRTIQVTAAQDADVYYIHPDGTKSLSGEAKPGEPLSLDTRVGHRFEIQDGFGDVVQVYTVTEKERQRVHVPAESEL